MTRLSRDGKAVAVAEQISRGMIHQSIATKINDRNSLKQRLSPDRRWLKTHRIIVRVFPLVSQKQQPA